MVKLNKCIEFKNSANNQELYFYGDIVSDAWDKWTDTDTCPQDVQDILNQIEANKPLDIYINSGGGSVFAGLAIYNMLKRCKAEKTVHVDGLAASIASVIAMAGDKIVMPSNAFLMIHKAWNIAIGNADDLRKTADDLDKIDQGILNVYKDNLKDGADIEEIKSMVANETWLTGEDAANYFNIEVVQNNKAVASISDISKYKNAPKNIVIKNMEQMQTCMCADCELGKNNACAPNTKGCNCGECGNESCTKQNEMNKIYIENLKAKLNLELIS